MPPGDHTLTFERAGFGTVVREGIHVGIGFTATVNIDMSPSTVSHFVTVSGAAPVVDNTSTAITTHFDTETLASLPGARETTFRVGRARVMGFFDVYNVFNTNAAQALTTSSGGSWLRPTAITRPRVLRIGGRWDW